MVYARACRAAIRQAVWRARSRPVDEALDWLRQHAVIGCDPDWETLRRHARSLAEGGRPADNYRAIRFVLTGLGDRHGRLLPPRTAARVRIGLTSGRGEGMGLVVVHPEHVVVQVAHGGPAMLAGIGVGDILTDFGDGDPPKVLDGRLVLDDGPDTGRVWTLRRAQGGVMRVSLRPAEYPLTQQPYGRRLQKAAGYLDLPQAVNATAKAYITCAHRAIEAVDARTVGGWVVDLRRNMGGNLYAMLAAAGPILGYGDCGGTVGARGKRMAWAYRDGNAYLRGSRLAGTAAPYRLYRPTPPVAVLTSGSPRVLARVLRWRSAVGPGSAASVSRRRACQPGWAPRHCETAHSSPRLPVCSQIAPARHIAMRSRRTSRSLPTGCFLAPTMTQYYRLLCAGWIARSSAKSRRYLRQSVARPVLAGNPHTAHPAQPGRQGPSRASRRIKDLPPCFSMLWRGKTAEANAARRPSADAHVHR